MLNLISPPCSSSPQKSYSSPRSCASLSFSSFSSSHHLPLFIFFSSSPPQSIIIVYPSSLFLILVFLNSSPQVLLLIFFSCSSQQILYITFSSLFFFLPLIQLSSFPPFLLLLQTPQSMINIDHTDDWSPLVPTLIFFCRSYSLVLSTLAESSHPIAQLSTPLRSFHAELTSRILLGWPIRLGSRTTIPVTVSRPFQPCKTCP